MSTIVPMRLVRRPVIELLRIRILRHPRRAGCERMIAADGDES
jgi:hypothetical protein